MSTPPDPTVTVLVTTYNHEGFIEAALASVLSQKTSFPFEIIVSEDCSTDSTREILERLAAEHPGRIQLLLSARNLNDNTVMRRGFEAARGRYLALLDGDDFWTADDKLQTQADFLDEHPEYSSCFHNVEVVYEGRPGANHLFHRDKPAEYPFAWIPKPVSTLADIAINNFIATCSAFVRTELVKNMPEWFDGLAAGDWPVHVVCAEHGGLAYLDRVMASYRIHSAGLWTAERSRYRTLAEVKEVARMYDVISEHLELRFAGEIDREVARFYEQRGVQFYKRAEYEAARHCVRRAIGRSPGASKAKRWKSAAALGLMRLPKPLRAGRERD